MPQWISQTRKLNNHYQSPGSSGLAGYNWGLTSPYYYFCGALRGDGELFFVPGRLVESDAVFDTEHGYYYFPIADRTRMLCRRYTIASGTTVRYYYVAIFELPGSAIDADAVPISESELDAEITYYVATPTKSTVDGVTRAVYTGDNRTVTPAQLQGRSAMIPRVKRYLQFSYTTKLRTGDVFPIDECAQIFSGWEDAGQISYGAWPDFEDLIDEVDGALSIPKTPGQHMLTFGSSQPASYGSTIGGAWVYGAPSSVPGQIASGGTTSSSSAWTGKSCIGSIKIGDAPIAYYYIDSGDWETVVPTNQTSPSGATLFIASTRGGIATTYSGYYGAGGTLQIGDYTSGYEDYLQLRTSRRLTGFSIVPNFQFYTVGT